MRICWLLLSVSALAWGQFRTEEIAKDLGTVYAVRLADVNGDGKKDIVAITGGRALWYENPTWKPHVISENVAPKDHVSIAAYDINGDGRLDFALAAEWQPRERATKGSLHWLEQKADGTFQLHDVAKIPGAHRIQWGDVDGDGKKELIVMPLEGKALVFFLPGWRQEVAAEGLELSHNFFLEDMNADGMADIVMASKNGLETLTRPASGVWQRHKTGEGQPGEVVLGRVNRYRVAATIEAFHGDRLVVYEEPLPRINPQFTPPPANWQTPISTQWKRAFEDKTVYGGHALGWADFDGDGSDELAFTWRGKETGVGILKRDANGEWKRAVALDGPGMSAEDLVIGDLNTDGQPDVVVCGRATGNIRIYWNEMKAKATWLRHEVSRQHKSLTAVGIRLNGMAKGRAIVAGADDSTVMYVPGRREPIELYKGASIIHSAVMDVDGDGDEDFIGADYSPGFVYWLEQPKNPLTEKWKFHLIEDSSHGPGINGVHGLHVADVDGDGKMELIANSGQPVGPLAHSIVWLKPLDGGKRWARNVFAKGDAPGLSHYHGAGDLNGDGLVDIVSAAKVGKDGKWFAWWEQPKTGREGAWTKHVLSDTEDGATNAQVADVNGDGKMDIIASRGHGLGLLWFEGPNFVKHEIDATLFGPHSLAIGDIDGDGDVDLVTCAKDSFVVAWFENDGKGGFRKHTLHENQAAYDIRLVDLDGDGDLDVLVAGQETRNVVWFENRIKR